MREYPRPVREAALKCIPCNAPLSETTGGRFVCIECGDARIEGRTPRSFSDELEGVRVEKRLEEDAGTDLAIRYTVESDRSDGVFVRVVDRFPDVVDLDGFSVHPTVEDVHWNLSASMAMFDRRLGADESVETALRATGRLPSLEDVATDPVVEVVRPLGTASDGYGDHVGMARTAGYHRDRTVGGSMGLPGRSEPAPPSRRRDGRYPPSALGFSAQETRSSAGSGRAQRAREDDGPTVLAAIPAYNEGRAISDVVAGAKATADDVTVVDDGSKDHTVAAAAGAEARVVEHVRNMGYGAALKTIFREAAGRNAECLVVLDGDGQHDPSDIPKLVDAYRDSGADIVIGSRFVDGSETDLPGYRRLGLLVINLLTNLSMGVVRPRSYVRDTQSGFRLYSERAIEVLSRVDGIGDRMDASVDILFVAHQRNFEIEEVGVKIDYDVENANSYNPFLHGYQLFNNVMKTIERERPLLSLGIPGLVVSASGVGFVWMAFDRYLQTGSLPITVFVLAVGGTVVGLFSCFTAIVLHALNTYFRKGF